MLEGSKIQGSLTSRLLIFALSHVQDESRGSFPCTSSVALVMEYTPQSLPFFCIGMFTIINLTNFTGDLQIKYLCFSFDTEAVVEWVIHIDHTNIITYVGDSNPMVAVNMKNLNKFLLSLNPVVPWRILLIYCEMPTLHHVSLLLKNVLCSINYSVVEPRWFLSEISNGSDVCI